jgi:hypothetical protein
MLKQLVEMNLRQAVQNSSSRDSVPTEDNPQENRFRAEEIGFFDPYLSTSRAEPGEITQLGDKTYYRDTRTFLDSAYSIDRTKKRGLVAQNLHTCLRGTAQQWYGSLNDEQRSQLRQSLDEWSTALRQHFAVDPGLALQKFQDQSYNLEDVWHDRHPMQYVNTVLRYGNALEMDVYYCLLQAHNKIHPTLRQNVPCPEKATTQADYVQQCEKN